VIKSYPLPMTDRKYEILHRESLFQGFFRVDRLHLRQELFTGGWSAPFSREVFSGCQKAAIVLLFDPQNDKVVMIEQFRPGPAAKNDNPFMLELVAGAVDPGETLEETAKRESREEAGCDVRALEKIFSYYPTPRSLSEHVTLFVGRTTAPEDGTIHGLEQEGEHIRVKVLDAAQAISLLYSGKLRDAASLIGLQWFALHHTDLRSRWLVSETNIPVI